MKALPLLVITLLMAACASSPIALQKTTFTGDYIDFRKYTVAKIVPVHREPLHVPIYLSERGLEASAVVAFMVETDGRTSEVQIVSATDEEFAEAARECVSGWRYAPPVKDGKPVRIVLEETVGWVVTASSGPKGIQ